ncbi:MAG TPA: biopolymer transporter ExbD [Ignavibacteriaceae bacterium]|jgi:biopolymer transport protein ExbD|nr:MAG: biopolymer transport protein ExbD [Ignavibacteria bacterium ADurb.Bin266]OQY71028.1 MAG: biopolymer transporter ExbD [Ignavibacteriales bacterium UTCHB2]HQF42930.1 biopolymer transporter ExbD [Ignavibacteriaceae bacterium]HQI41952.1 biopolymer transporter ExbD [Ignavibacteriaceae bacterium]HQJ45776.1 biopolymer transporter ExbD [Ignavibacteriaceae bacterium]
MTFEKRRAKTKQEIPTTSMPDIVFMLLMFFMCVTTMREVDVLVQFKLPEAKAIEKIENKRLVSYIWVGKDKRIQINDSLIDLGKVEEIMYGKKKTLPELIVSLRSDQNVDMGLITDIQQALRKAYCLRINYSAMIKV